MLYESTIFSGAPIQVEKDMNDFFQKNTDIRIDSLAQSETRSQAENQLTVTIIFRRKQEELETAPEY